MMRELLSRSYVDTLCGVMEHNSIRWRYKVHPRTGLEVPEGELRYSSTLSLSSTLDMGGWSTPRPSRFTPRKDLRYPLYRRLGGLQGRSGRVWKISPLLGFDPPDRPARSGSLCRPTYNSLYYYYYYYYYYSPLSLCGVFTVTHPCFWGTQCCSYSVVTVYGTCDDSHVRPFVLLH